MGTTGRAGRTRVIDRRREFIPFMATRVGTEFIPFYDPRQANNRRSSQYLTQHVSQQVVAAQNKVLSINPVNHPS